MKGHVLKHVKKKKQTPHLTQGTMQRCGGGETTSNPNTSPGQHLCFRISPFSSLTPSRAWAHDGVNWTLLKRSAHSAWNIQRPEPSNTESRPSQASAWTKETRDGLDGEHLTALTQGTWEIESLHLISQFLGLDVVGGGGGETKTVKDGKQTMQKVTIQSTFALFRSSVCLWDLGCPKYETHRCCRLCALNQRAIIQLNTSKSAYTHSVHAASAEIMTASRPDFDSSVLTFPCLITSLWNNYSVKVDRSGPRGDNACREIPTSRYAFISKSCHLKKIIVVVVLLVLFFS